MTFAILVHVSDEFLIAVPYKTKLLSIYLYIDIWDDIFDNGQNVMTVMDEMYIGQSDMSNLITLLFFR